MKKKEKMKRKNEKGEKKREKRKRGKREKKEKKGREKRRRGKGKREMRIKGKKTVCHQSSQRCVTRCPHRAYFGSSEPQKAFPFISVIATCSQPRKMTWGRDFSSSSERNFQVIIQGKVYFWAGWMQRTQKIKVKSFLTHLHRAILLQVLCFAYQAFCSELRQVVDCTVWVIQDRDAVEDGKEETH